MRQCHVPTAVATSRVDQWLAAEWSDLSRSDIQKALKHGEITIDGETAKPSTKLSGGEVIVYQPTETVSAPVATPMPLDIRYEDDTLLVINKPQGLVVHPAHAHQSDTLVNGLLAYAAQKQFSLATGSDPMRPGIVHRLDKDTSGLLVVAKTAASYNYFIQQFQSHAVQRTYYALVYGAVTPATGTIDAPISRDPKQRLRFTVTANGKPAITHYHVLDSTSAFSLVRFTLETGRTHQIRVHAQYKGHPVADDPLYAADHKPQFFTEQGQLLHAKTLSFTHPTSGQHLTIDSPLPSRFQRILTQVGLALPE